MPESIRPGDPLASRPLHFFWVVDGSGSMAQDGKVQALNTAVREALPPLRQVAADNPTAEVLVRAVRFATGASWHVADPTSVERFSWPDVTAEGRTDLGQALRLVANAVRVPPMSDRALPPVIVLVSDGMPTDDYKTGLNELLTTTWGKNAVRVAIAIGRDAARDILEEFIGGEQPQVLEADSADALVSQMRWASVVAVRSVVVPGSRTPSGDPPTRPVPIPSDPAAGSGYGQDVW